MGKYIIILAFFIIINYLIPSAKALVASFDYEILTLPVANDQEGAEQSLNDTFQQFNIPIDETPVLNLNNLNSNNDELLENNFSKEDFTLDISGMMEQNSIPEISLKEDNLDNTFTIANTDTEDFTPDISGMMEQNSIPEISLKEDNLDNKIKIANTDTEEISMINVSDTNVSNLDLKFNSNKEMLLHSSDKLSAVRQTESNTTSINYDIIYKNDEIIIVKGSDKTDNYSKEKNIKMQTNLEQKESHFKDKVDPNLVKNMNIVLENVQFKNALSLATLFKYMDNNLKKELDQQLYAIFKKIGLKFSEPVKFLGIGMKISVTKEKKIDVKNLMLVAEKVLDIDNMKIVDDETNFIIVSPPNQLNENLIKNINLTLKLMKKSSFNKTFLPSLVMFVKTIEKGIVGIPLKNDMIVYIKSTSPTVIIKEVLKRLLVNDAVYEKERENHLAKITLIFTLLSVFSVIIGTGLGIAYGRWEARHAKHYKNLDFKPTYPV